MSNKNNQGRMKPFIKIIASVLSEDPRLFQDYDKLIEKVKEVIPELQNEQRCPNCEASMVQYAYNLDIIDISLIVGMANKVRENKKTGIDFTEANKVHVPTLPVSDAVRHRTTKCAKLGLVAKSLKDGKHTCGMWVITRRGFEALRGLEIPTGVVAWRGKTIEHAEATTTFAKVIAWYRPKVEVGKEDLQHSHTMKYKQNEWIDFAGYNNGRLF